MELDTTLGLALQAAEILLACCEPIPPVSATIDSQGKRQVTVGHEDTFEVATAIELKWEELRQDSAKYRCVAVAASAQLVGKDQVEPIVTATVEHAEGQTVEVVIPYRRRRRLIRHKVVLGELVSRERDGRVWS
ncbi:hypothetical protein [Actinomadura terrae]|uniref:hypothetical protein n=1 Tax=Actinomadura terrae TaxID=604353 RepID=UPI001FA7A86C|nr:hypothetical protein [Actinomadura terrae]